MRPRLRIGTRGSPLARVQAALAVATLEQAHPELAEPGALEIVAIRTSGDRLADRPLAELGGKGLFCKELEAALLERRIDLAVHSMKDLPTWLPEGLVIGAILEREDPRDVLLTRNATALDDLGLDALERGAVIGSGSLRRKAQLLQHRPDLEVVGFRGNVETRLRKLAAGEVDATLLALAGLKRLGIDPGGTVLSPEVMLPAVAQGAIGIECRADDDRTRALLAAIDHPGTSVCVRTERALLAALDGSCRTPIAGYAELEGELLHLRALIARPDGSVCLRAERMGAIADGEALGSDAGRELKVRAGPDFFD
jgi:hydroxymethylbilane synthase